MSRSQNHLPEKVEKAWELKVAGHTVRNIAKILRIPYDTLNDWFHFRTRVRVNMAASRKAGWWKIAKKHSLEVA